MDTIQRPLKQIINKYLTNNKVIILLGSRRVGKTILIKSIENDFVGNKLHLNGDDIDTHVILKERTVANYKRLLQNVALLIIDEAQEIPEIGKILKLIVDEIKPIKIIVTGSSAFDLLNNTGEPLTGRSYSFMLYPIAQLELMPNENILNTRQNLDERLIYGSYPELFHLNTLAEKENYLKSLVQSYLLKDILAIDNGVRNTSKFNDLLKLLAYQIGKEVSYDELGKQLGMSKNTVEKYLDLLSKVFIVYKVSGFSRNLRKEIVKTTRWYFMDNGIRNAIISNFNLPALRMDMGELWENYLMAERIKRNTYKELSIQKYFWRTYDQQEIDLIETQQDTIHAFEFKYGDNKKIKVPSGFKNAYPDAIFTVINRENYLDFIS